MQHHKIRLHEMIGKLQAAGISGDDPRVAEVMAGKSITIGKSSFALAPQKNSAALPTSAPTAPTQSGSVADHGDRVWASFVAAKHGAPGTPRYEAAFTAELERTTNANGSAHQ